MKLTSPMFDDEELRLVKECLDSCWVTQGPFTRRLEEAFAARHEVPHALAMTSCTAALHLSMLALGLGPGDEVVVPAFTWVTSAHCAEYVGAKVVFADVEADTYNLDPAALEAAITPRTRAVVVVHLFGLAAKLKEILDIAAKHDLAVVEDAACATGTTYDGKPVGGFGDTGCFSFHPRKVITTGEGGMLATRRGDLAEIVASLRNHGGTGLKSEWRDGPPPYAMATFERLGYNLRLSDIQAAVGVAQMAKLEGLLAERKRRAERYQELLADVEEIARPVVPEPCEHTFQSYVIRVISGGIAKRNHAMERLAAASIETRPGTHAVHRLGYYVEKYGLKPDDFPVAARSEDTTITLPLFPGMTDADQDRVVAELKQALR